MASDKVTVDLALLGETHRVEGDWALVVSGTQEAEGTRMEEAFMGSAGREGLAAMAKTVCRAVRTVADQMGAPSRVVMMLMSVSAMMEARRESGPDDVKVTDVAARAEMRRMARELGIDADF